MRPGVPGPPGLGFTSGRVKRLRQLLERSSVRRREGAFVVEGPTLVGDALDAGAELECLFVAPGLSPRSEGRSGPVPRSEGRSGPVPRSEGRSGPVPRSEGRSGPVPRSEGRSGPAPPVVDRAAAAGVPVFELAPGVLERVAGTVSPQPVLAVARTVDVDLATLAGETLVVVCVDVRDPGNLGTVVRSAEAAGAGGIICCGGSVDVFNPKCVRASAGALFHTRIVARGEPVEVLGALGEWGLRRLGTRPGAGQPYDRVDLTVPTALVIGNEAGGLAAPAAGAVDGWVTIPMAGRSESLNVGMAAAVLCFEAARQRRR